MYGYAMGICMYVWTLPADPETLETLAELACCRDVADPRRKPTNEVGPDVSLRLVTLVTSRPTGGRRKRNVYFRRGCGCLLLSPRRLTPHFFHKGGLVPGGLRLCGLTGRFGFACFFSLPSFSFRFSVGPGLAP